MKAVFILQTQFFISDEEFCNCSIPNFSWSFQAKNQEVLLEACGCLPLCSCRIPPDLTQECVLGDDEGRI